MSDLNPVCELTVRSGLLSAEWGRAVRTMEIGQRRQAIWENRGAWLVVVGLQQHFQIQ